MDSEKLDRLLQVFDERSWAINRAALVKAAQHLKDIGQLAPSDIHRLAEMRRLNTSMDEIAMVMAEQLNVDVSDINAVLAQVVKENDWAAYTMLANGGERAPILGNRPLMQLLVATSNTTRSEMVNLSRTTIDSSAYRTAVDNAIHAVTSGVSDYGSVIRQNVRMLSREGLKVEYPSGVKRRLDTAVRQNVLDGARYVNSESARLLGMEYGADGVEIDAHGLCADDHLPYQGKQYTIKEFEKIQGSLPRPFGQWNCRHNISYIVLGASPPAYTEGELSELNSKSTEEIEINGITKTRYDWSQTMRRLETETRYVNDETEALKAIGDKAGVRMSENAASKIVDTYDEVWRAAGLEPQYWRMYVGRAKRNAENVQY